jgi:hypothetical protein
MNSRYCATVITGRHRLDTQRTIMPPSRPKPVPRHRFPIFADWHPAAETTSASATTTIAPRRLPIRSRYGPVRPVQS